ncbi:MAG: hypothetical protein U5N10_01985 [Gemmobacter sp.]|nr:hypothetical protein [Gemmobacter sp.]
MPWALTCGTTMTGAEDDIVGGGDGGAGTGGAWLRTGALSMWTGR